jgi:hypothetical protein
LWKHVKNRLRTKYYHEFDEFMGKIDSIIDETSKKDKNLIDRLIGSYPFISNHFWHDIKLTERKKARLKQERWRDDEREINGTTQAQVAYF